MLISKTPNTSIRNALFGVAALLLVLPCKAVEFVPYPGKRMVRLMEVIAPDLIQVNFDTDMVGFFRAIRIRIPGIAIPKDVPDAALCERELAKQAMDFTQSFLRSAKNLYVKDMRMKTSADEEALSPILTNHGSLAEKLIDKGFARPNNVPSNMPWCISE